MTMTGIGYDYVGVQSVKITKGTYPPLTTDDSLVARFLYNSKWSKDVKLSDLKVRSLNTTAGPTYTPSSSNWTMFHAYYNGNQNEVFTNPYFSNMLYTFPLYDIKVVDSSTGRYIGGVVEKTLSGYDNRGGAWRLRSARQSGWLAADATYTFSGYFAATLNPQQPSIRLQDWNQPANSLTDLNHLIIWRLPGDNTAIIDGTPLAAVAGQQQVRITSTECKVSKPGFDVRTATATQLAFDASNIPAKIIAAADIAVPAGSSSYNCGITLPANTVVDLHFYEEGGAIAYPAPPLSTDFGASYWIDGSLIRFSNPNAACRARFLVYAADSTGPTSGTNNVLRQFTSGGENVVQFLRPGASATPSFADIAIDSRWPAVQILAEGYIAVGTGENTYVVNYSGAGMFTFVKYVTVHGAGNYSVSGDLQIAFSKRVRVPTAGKCAVYDVGWTNMKNTGDSTYVTYGQVQATFHTFKGNPIRQYYNQSDYPTIHYEYDPSPIVGIRYYVLGIAQ
ncbi:hypothetical protein [Ciceribacter thiooxidans]|uniref:Uncharacterized protein n=1 Tax=Ciceribacter thiooxidans TaxID=1969821 RepID=A0ABV7HXF5_9HYPH|nr:hypothetical protein [Ciceribacter thiooxidans]